jgi:tetratricopeptide (TPR) repeat protein
MRNLRSLKFVPAVLGLLCVASACHAQSFVIDLPAPSQHAIITQRIGLTDITINYHRPLVNGRPIWGKLVPYGQPWRAGANENTTVSFTDPVSIEGQSLAAGTYGLHMIPAEKEWIVIFSKQNAAWGSFTYKQDEDALRVTVKPAASDMHEALTYDFDELKPDSSVITMRWEKVAIPFKVSVSLNDTVAAHLHQDFRGLVQYTWEGYNDAADYLAKNKMDLDDALKYADNAIQTEPRYESLETKSEVLEAMGRKDDAAKFHEQALDRANAVQLYQYARGLQRAGKQQEAIAVFRKQVKKYPDEWISHAAAGRIDTSEGNYDAALKEMHQALDAAPDPSKPSVQGLIKRLESKDDINK